MAEAYTTRRWQMVRLLAYRFLTHFGTLFRQAEPQYSHTPACRLYAKMMLKRDQYAKMFKSKGFGGFKNKQMGGVEERREASGDTGVGATSIPAPPCVMAVVQTLL